MTPPWSRQLPTTPYTKWCASLAVVTAFILGVVLWLPPPAHAGAASNGLWSVFPTDVNGRPAREFVQPVLTPGRAYDDSVTVTNATSAPLTFRMYASDAFNTPGGGLSLRRRTDAREDIGKWIMLSTSQLTVAPHGSSVVRFSIFTPVDASPGDHVGGIVAEETQGTASQAGSTPITVLEAVGVRVYGRVVGPLHPRLSLERASLSVDRSPATLFTAGVTAHVRFTVANSGNTVLSSSAGVRLSTPLGTAAQRTISVGQLLPGNSLHYTLEFPGVRSLGQLRAQIAVAALGAQASQSESAWVMPWATLGIVVLAVVVSAAFAVRRRSAKPVPDPDSTTNTDGAAN